jgi:menaquinone-dependent protoporphyrinogen oxidase
METTTRVLVAYASKHGSTKEIAQAIAARIATHGATVECHAAEEVKDLGGYDAVVLGSAVYTKRWRGPARAFLRRHRRALADRPFWIFSSGPVGKDADPSWSEPRGVVAAAEKLGVREHVVFGGRLPVDGGFIARSMRDNTPEELRDMRDWDQIDAWADGVAAALAPMPVA